jgi:hypothetical protein
MKQLFLFSEFVQLKRASGRACVLPAAIDTPEN